MNWKEEFITQWQSFLDIVETLIRKEINENGHLDSILANKIIKSEVEKWSLSTHYNGAWLRNLTRKYPDIGEDFRSTLKELNLNREIAFRSSLPILPIGVSLILMEIFFFGLDWLHLLNNSLPKIVEWLNPLNDSLFKKIGLTILIGLAAFSVLNILHNQKKQNKINRLIDLIKLNLDQTGSHLSAIASRADELDLKTKEKT